MVIRISDVFFLTSVFYCALSIYFSGKTVRPRIRLWNKRAKDIKSIFQSKKQHVKFYLIESLLESVHIFSIFFFFLVYLCVFFLLCSFLFCFLLTLSDKRRQSAKPSCSGTNLSIMTDGTLTTCTLKIKPALKACA